MGRSCSQADLANNISDTSLETRWFPWALCLRKTYRLVIFHVHDWDWLGIASLPCSPAWTLPKIRHHHGRNPTVLTVSFGPGCHLSCGTMTWLLSYCLRCAALLGGSCWRLTAREGEGERCQEQQKMERHSFPEEGSKLGTKSMDVV